MIDGKSVLGLVVARGGSKGLPRKNVLDLGGRPLVAWSVAAGLASQTIDRLIISTDDTEIAEAAQQAGCEVPFMRPAALAQDTTGSAEVVEHALKNLSRSYDFMVLLQATSPLRSAQDIDDAVRLCHQSGASSCVSVTPSTTSPYWMVTRDGEGWLSPVITPPPGVKRRQDLPVTYEYNGAVYVVRVPWFLDNLKFVAEDTQGIIMPAERSVDIDTLRDLQMARLIMDSLVEPGHP